jgi:hypothetical protein
MDSKNYFSFEVIQKIAGVNWKLILPQLATETVVVTPFALEVPKVSLYQKFNHACGWQERGQSKL